MEILHLELQECLGQMCTKIKCVENLGAYLYSGKCTQNEDVLCRGPAWMERNYGAVFSRNDVSCLYIVNGAFNKFSS
jgi:hypothetical protein